MSFFQLFLGLERSTFTGTFCGGNMSRFFWALVAALSFFACTNPDSGEGPNATPQSPAGAYRLFPNDSASNDSAAAWLAKGVFIRVQPQGSYSISFQVSTDSDAPTLHLFRVVPVTDSTWKPVYLKSVSARLSGNRWYYDFECSETAANDWSVTLEGANGDFWTGKVRNVHFSGSGAYDSHFAINLVVAGEFGGFSDGVTKDSAAHLLQSYLRSYLDTAGVRVDTVVLRMANQHPTQGSSYPESRPIEATYDAYGISNDELGGWNIDGLYNALDVVLVHRFAIDGLLGLSPLYGGSLGGGSGSTIALATHYTSGSSEINVSSSDWVNTAFHEMAHFFGVRHTTSTAEDIEGNDGDASNVEDGFADTPTCGSVIQGGNWMGRLVGRIKVAGVTNLSSCPDANNVMFPIALDNVKSVRMTKSQLKMWQYSLELFPH